MYICGVGWGEYNAIQYNIHYSLSLSLSHTHTYTHTHMLYLLQGRLDSPDLSRRQEKEWHNLCCQYPQQDDNDEELNKV